MKFPADLDGHYFAGEFGRRWIKAIDVNPDGSRGAIADFPWSGTQVMDMSFGPDGALYVLDYGSGFGNGDENSALYRIEHIGGGNRAPVAVANANRTSGAAPLTVTFSSAGSTDPEGGSLTYAWAFGDGTNSTAANPTKTYTANGTYTATLTVRDPQGATGSASVRISVGNTAPTVTIQNPVNGRVFTFGDAVPFQVSVSDPEDGAIDCGRVTMTYILGHDSHGHEITSRTGCSGTITIPPDGEHDEAANIFGVFDAEYTDNGGITVHTQHTLQPRHRQAEHFTTSSGVQLVRQDRGRGRPDRRATSTTETGSRSPPYALAGVTSFTARVSSGGAGGTLSLRAGSPTGTVLGSATVPVTGGWETFTTVSGTLSGAPSRHDLAVPRVHRRVRRAVRRRLVHARRRRPGSVAGSGGGRVVQLAVRHPGGGRPGRARRGPCRLHRQRGLARLRHGQRRRPHRVHRPGSLRRSRRHDRDPHRLGRPARFSAPSTVPNTGGYGAFVDVSTSLRPGSGSVVLRFAGSGGGLFDIDDFALTGSGPPSTNLALNRPASADSSCNPNEGPDKAVNGTVTGGSTDKWCSLGATKWWRVDLQSTRQVGRVRRPARRGRRRERRLEHPRLRRADQHERHHVDHRRADRGNTANVTTHTFAPAGARYVRLNIINHWRHHTAARIYEVEVYTS